MFKQSCCLSHLWLELHADSCFNWSNAFSLQYPLQIFLHFSSSIKGFLSKITLHWKIYLSAYPEMSILTSPIMRLTESHFVIFTGASTKCWKSQDLWTFVRKAIFLEVKESIYHLRWILLWFLFSLHTAYWCCTKHHFAGKMQRMAKGWRQIQLLLKLTWLGLWPRWAFSFRVWYNSFFSQPYP